MDKQSIQKYPLIRVLLNLLAVVYLPAVHYCQPAEARGNFKYAADVSWNMLTIQFDIASLSNSAKTNVIAWRYDAVRFFPASGNPDQDNILLMWRNITSDAFVGRATYEILSSNISSFKGRDATIVVYQVTRRLLADTSPSKDYLASIGGVLDPESTSPASQLYFLPKQHESRVLAFTESNTNNKTVTVPTSYLTYDSNDFINFTMVFHLFTVVYWFATVYLIFLNPWFEHSRKSVRIFWTSYFPMYFQLIVLITQLSPWYYRQTDMVFSLLNMAHLRFFGMDLTVFSSTSDAKDRLSATLGKFATRYVRFIAPSGSAYQNDDPRIICTMLPQTIIFLVAVVASLATKDKLKETFVMMRLACTTCFGVQLAFRSTWSFHLLFSYGGTLGILDYLSGIIGAIIVLLLLIDCFVMKSQTMTLQDSQNLWTTIKAKGALYFDIIGYTGHKKYRDYYPFILGESELVFLIAVLTCTFGYNPLIQAIVLLVLALLLFLSVVILSQFTLMKILKLVLHLSILVHFGLNLICALTITPDVSTARILGQAVLINLFFLLGWNLLFFIIRLYDLLQDSSSTYGEKAKPVPPQKIKGATSSSSKNPPMKAAGGNPGPNQTGFVANNNGFGGQPNNQNPNMSGFANAPAGNQTPSSGFGMPATNQAPVQNGTSNIQPASGLGAVQNGWGANPSNAKANNPGANPYTNNNQGAGGRQGELDNSRWNLMDQSMTNDASSRANNQVPTYNFGREFDNSSYKA
jgi:hypothetical protein